MNFLSDTHDESDSVNFLTEVKQYQSESDLEKQISCAAHVSDIKHIFYSILYFYIISNNSMNYKLNFSVIIHFSFTIEFLLLYEL